MDLSPALGNKAGLGGLRLLLYFVYFSKLGVCEIFNFADMKKKFGDI